ncbi:MAG: class I SAM-dependent methyltransferase [Pseudomonadota bacterium]
MPLGRRPEAIGGWLKDADAGMDRRHRRLSDIDASELNGDHLAYFEDYRTRYFNDRLLPGQGVEEILGTLSAHGGSPETWVDLGAGVTTLFWSIGVNQPGRVIACDLVPEALKVLAAFKESDEIPPCYREAMDLTHRSRAAFDAVRTGAWEYHVLDCLAPWDLPGYADGFDLTSAIGCFGLAPDAARYSQAFRAAVGNLRPGGRFVGADWIRSAAFVDREGHDNSYVAGCLTEACGVKAGLRPLTMERVAIEGDPSYDAVLVWAFSA